MKFNQLVKEEYEGVDADLDTALYEYGLVWKCIDEKKKGYHFLYGVDMTTNDGETDAEYSLFDWGDMTEQAFIDLVNEDWFDKKAFDECRGNTEVLFPLNVHDALMYHGHENIFGSSYYPFKIEKED